MAITKGYSSSRKEHVWLGETLGKPSERDPKATGAARRVIAD